MIRKSTKFLTLLLALLMCISLLAGCGGGAAPQDQAGQGEQPAEGEQAVPAESYKVGIVVYDNTDLLTQSILEYLSEHLGHEFNVEFIVSDAIKDSNQEISFIENLAAKGAKGVIALYSVTDPQIMYDKVRELGMYYVFGARIPEPKEMEAAKSNPYFLGGVGCASGDYNGAYEITKIFLEKDGARKIGIASGGKDFGVKMFIDRYNGVMDAVKDFEEKNPGTQIQVDELGGFPNDAWFAGQAKMIASNPDAIFTFSPEFLWVQPLIDAGKAGEVKLGTISAFLPIAADAVNNGHLHYVGAIYPQMTALPFAVLYNAMSGHASEFTDNGNPVSINLPLPMVKSPEEMNKWMEVVYADVPPYSADDIKKVTKAFNPDATYQDLIDLANASGYDDIVKRRASE